MSEEKKEKGIHNPLCCGCFVTILFILGIVYLVIGCNPSAGACLKYIKKEAVAIEYHVKKDNMYRKYEWTSYMKLRYDGYWNTTTSAVGPSAYLGGHDCITPRVYWKHESLARKYLNKVCPLGDHCTVFRDKMDVSQCIDSKTGFSNWVVGTILLTLSLVFLVCGYINFTVDDPPSDDSRRMPMAAKDYGAMEEPMEGETRDQTHVMDKSDPVDV